MKSGQPIPFDELKPQPAANGFNVAELLQYPGFEMAYLSCEKEAGHDSHFHDDAHEVLVFLEGACVFSVEERDYQVQAGALIHLPPGVKHKVGRYQEGSKVLRIKFNPTVKEGVA